MIFDRWTLTMLPRLGTVRHMRGMYATWEQAATHSIGYSSAEIFENSLRAARSVRDGAAVWQRDSVLFPEVQYSWPVMAEIACRRRHDNGQRQGLHVLDFGGGLGSSFLQYRAFAPDDHATSWTIVEQPNIVEAGEREFAFRGLRFCETIPERAVFQPDVVLLSSVLQYLPDAERVVKRLLALSPLSVIVDRTPISQRGFYSVQTVPRRIYKAAYPIRIFADSELSDMFDGWQLLQEFPSYCDNPKKLFRGRIYRRVE